MVGWLVLGPSYFSRTMLCSLFFCPVFFAALFCGVCAKNSKSSTHTPALSRARSASPPGRPRSSSRMASASTPTSELATQSPALASSLAEPPPAASPQLGRWICPQGLRSARVRGLLLLVLLLLRRLLVPFYGYLYFSCWHHHSYSGYLIVRMPYMGACTAMWRLLHCCILQCSTSVCSDSFSWTWMEDHVYLKNTYGFIRHRINYLCLIRQAAAWYFCSGRCDIGAREAFECRKWQHLYRFQTPPGRVHGSDPRGAGTPRALRQADTIRLLKKANPQARYAGSTRGSATTHPPAVHGGLIRE